MLFCNVILNKFTTTGGSTYILFRPACGYPDPCPVTASCGASGGDFSYAYVIASPCYTIPYKINKWKQS